MIIHTVPDNSAKNKRRYNQNSSLLKFVFLIDHYETDKESIKSQRNSFDPVTVKHRN